MANLWSTLLTGFVLPRSVLICACGSDPVPLPTTLTVTSLMIISGNHLLRDEELWITHVERVMAFVASLAAQTGVFTAAYARYRTAEIEAREGFDLMMMMLCVVVG